MYVGLHGACCSWRNSVSESPSQPRPAASSLRHPVNLTVCASDGLASVVTSSLRQLCEQDDGYRYKGVVYSLDYRPISGNISLPQNAIATEGFSPDGPRAFRPLARIRLMRRRLFFPALCTGRNLCQSLFSTIDLKPSGLVPR